MYIVHCTYQEELSFAAKKSEITVVRTLFSNMINTENGWSQIETKLTLCSRLQQVLQEQSQKQS